MSIGLAECGTSTCEGDESFAKCPNDCAAFAIHLAAPCTATGTQDTCGRGWFCVDRAASAGGPVCVADFPTWPPLADTRATEDFAEQADIILDKATGLTWAKNSLRDLSWRDAMVACTQQKWAGQNDWRMPTRAEMRSLLDFSVENPAAPFVHLDWNPASLRYWVVLPVPTESGHGMEAFSVNLGDAKLGSERTDTPLAVRCVRGGRQVNGKVEGRFVLRDGGATVFDRITGLSWQRGAPGTPLGWSDAQAYCATNAAQLSGTGWRLPSLRELEGLIEIGPTTPALDPLFAVTSEVWQWTSSVMPGNPGAMWMQSWIVGPDAGGKGDARQVRCVR